MIELSSSTDTSAYVRLNISVNNWIIASKHRSGSTLPYKVTNIDLTFDPTEDMRRVPSRMSLTGYWATSNGYKWRERQEYFNWYNNDQIEFLDLPQVIQNYIYAQLLSTSSNLSQKIATNVIDLADCNGKFRLPLPQLDAENPDPFLPSVKRSNNPSKWENHDVSRWSIARKELGLPKPKRTRKSQV